MKLSVLLCIAVASCVVASGLDFVVLGDWGGSGSSPYTTPGEIAVSKGMNDVAGKIGSKFTLALGDNMYSNGVKNVDDPRFKHTFEDVFTGSNLQSTWHMVLGNHDHAGNASAQIAYTKKQNRWSLPDYYYTFTESAGAGVEVQFVIIDTVQLSGNSDHVDRTMPPSGPADPAAAADQWTWIEDTLKASSAQYLIVAGHYPVWSIAEHGPTSDLVAKLKPLLEQYNATAYFCGHDHAEEYIDESKGVQYHVFGAAHECDSSTAHKGSVPAGSLKFHWASGLSGFGSVHIDESGFVATHYDDKGKVIYTAPKVGPRS